MTEQGTDPYYNADEVRVALDELDFERIKELAQMDPAAAVDFVVQAVWADTTGKTIQQKDSEVASILDRVNRERVRSVAPGGALAMPNGVIPQANI